MKKATSDPAAPSVFLFVFFLLSLSLSTCLWLISCSPKSYVTIRTQTHKKIDINWITHYDNKHKYQERTNYINWIAHKSFKNACSGFTSEGEQVNLYDYHQTLSLIHIITRNETNPIFLGVNQTMPSDGFWDMYQFTDQLTNRPKCWQQQKQTNSRVTCLHVGTSAPSTRNKNSWAPHRFPDMITHPGLASLEQ